MKDITGKAIPQTEQCPRCSSTDVIMPDWKTEPDLGTKTLLLSADFTCNQCNAMWAVYVTFGLHFVSLMSEKRE